MGFAHDLEFSIVEVEEARQALNPTRSPGDRFAQALFGANDPSTSVGMGSALGSVIGSYFGYPGLGATIGGAWGGAKMDEAHARALETLNAKVDNLERHFAERFRAIWDHLSSGILVSHTHFEKAFEQWEALLAKNDPQQPHSRLVEAIESFVLEFGPMPIALSSLIDVYLPPFQLNEGEAQKWSSVAIQLYPQLSITWLVAARLEVARGNWTSGLECTTRGLKAAPVDRALLLLKIELLATIGDFEAAREISGSLNEPEALVHELRGAARRTPDDIVQSVVRLRLQGVSDVELAAVLKVLPDIEKIALSSGNFPSLSSAPRLLELIAKHLPADGATTFWGPPPAERLANARASFLKVSTSEPIYYFNDWSIWGNGKIGLAITRDCLAWKCLWQAPVIVFFSSLRPHDIRLDRSTVFVRDERMDVPTPELAGAIVDVLRGLQTQGA